MRKATSIQEQAPPREITRHTTIETSKTNQQCEHNKQISFTFLKQCLFYLTSNSQFENLTELKMGSCQERTLNSLKYLY